MNTYADGRGFLPNCGDAIALVGENCERSVSSIARWEDEVKVAYFRDCKTWRRDRELDTTQVVEYFRLVREAIAAWYGEEGWTWREKRRGGGSKERSLLLLGEKIRDKQVFVGWEESESDVTGRRVSALRKWLTKREGTVWAVALDMALDLVPPEDFFTFPDLNKHSMDAMECLDHCWEFPLFLPADDLFRARDQIGPSHNVPSPPPLITTISAMTAITGPG